MATRSFATGDRRATPSKVNLGGRYLRWDKLWCPDAGGLSADLTLLLCPFSTAWLGYIDLSQLTRNTITTSYDEPLAVRGIRKLHPGESAADDMIIIAT